MNLGLHGLGLETSIYHWQDQPDSYINRTVSGAGTNQRGGLVLVRQTEREAMYCHCKQWRHWTSIAMYVAFADVQVSPASTAALSVYKCFVSHRFLSVRHAQVWVLGCWLFWEDFNERGERKKVTFTVRYGKRGREQWVHESKDESEWGLSVCALRMSV